MIALGSSLHQSLPRDLIWFSSKKAKALFTSMDENEDALHFSSKNFKLQALAFLFSLESKAKKLLSFILKHQMVTAHC